MPLSLNQKISRLSVDLSCVYGLNAVVFQNLTFILRHFKRTLVFTTENIVP